MSSSEPEHASFRMSGGLTPSLAFRVALIIGVNLAFLVPLLAHLPNWRGELGHDYGYWFPRLLAGYYWFRENGLTAIPWFTPALGGGMPLYADPESIYISVPQFLVFVFDPLTSVRLTAFVFGVCGFVGCYFMLRRAFASAFASSFLGATLFLFNGFYLSRMLVGHLSAHGFMLLPCIALLLLPAPVRNRGAAEPESGHCPAPRVRARDRLALLPRGCAAGLVFSYCIYSGGIHIIVPMTLSLLGLVLLHVLFHGEAVNALTRGAVFAGSVLLFCASKLVTDFALLANLPRTGYPLPGFRGIVPAVLVPFQSVFFRPWQAEAAPGLLANCRWALRQHEFEYGISPVPLFLLGLAWIGWWRHCRGRGRNPAVASRSGMKIAAGAGLAVLFAVPIAVNTYAPGWNAWLKAFPVIGSSSSLLRWYAFYILTVITAAVVCFDRYGGWCGRCRHGLIAGLAVAAVAWTLCRDQTYYTEQSYQAAQMLMGYAAAQSGDVRPVTHLGWSARYLTDAGVMLLTDEATMLAGVSQLGARLSLFGYELEFFPQREKLEPGPVKQVKAGVYNMKDPAFYLFPKANGGRPGDHFPVCRRAALDNFLSYRPYTFRKAKLQHLADAISVLSLTAFAALSAVALGRTFWHRWARGRARDA